MTIEELKTTIAGLRGYGMEDNQEPLKAMLADLQEMERQAKETHTPMYDTLLANAKFPVSQTKKDCIERTICEFLRTDLTPDQAREPGLLLGNIQCGKTDTFENIIGLAFDKGFDIAVVLTKNNTALTEQTKLRFLKDYKYFLPGVHSRVTVHIHDIMDVRNVGLNEATVALTKTVIVCKKETRNLDSLSNLFNQKSSFLLKKKVLIVDDEADFASRNYKKRGKGINAVIDAQKTTEAIDVFRGQLGDCRYLQVTATPYSLLLQPNGKLNVASGTLEPFKPRFITVVPAHPAYIGAWQYFVESKDPNSMYSELHMSVAPNNMKILYKKYQPYLSEAGRQSRNMFNLEYAIVCYIMSTAVRRIQARRDNSNSDFHSSAVFHVEVAKDKHDWQYELISSVVESIKEQFSSGKFAAWLESCIQYAERSLKQSNGLAVKASLIRDSFPTINQIKDEMRSIIVCNNYEVKKINSDNAILPLLNKETGELMLTAAANIFVGGNILDRGITIQHMLCFFYGRNPGTFQQDTVLQHARMFGARSLEDMAVTRFHTTPRIYRAFGQMCMADEDLRQRIIDSNNSGKDISIQFVGYGKDFKPCAPSKTAASEMKCVKCNQRILPVGFMAGCRSNISKTVNEIENLIVNSPKFTKKDADGFFEMDKATVVKLLGMIDTTYLYSAHYQNEDFKDDIKDMICTLDYVLSQTHTNIIYCWHLTGRNLNRLRSNGGFVDSPEGGAVYIDKMRVKAKESPVVAFIKEKGDKNEVNGTNIGWNGAEFYWPVLMTQSTMSSAMFTTDNK